MHVLEQDMSRGTFPITELHTSIDDYGQVQFPPAEVGIHTVGSRDVGLCGTDGTGPREGIGVGAVGPSKLGNICRWPIRKKIPNSLPLSPTPLLSYSAAVAQEEARLTSASVYGYQLSLHEILDANILHHSRVNGVGGWLASRPPTSTVEKR